MANARNAELEAEVAQLRAERDSLARIAASSLRVLRHEAHEPVGFWIRESEQATVQQLLDMDELEDRLPSNDRWGRATIQPVDPITPAPRGILRPPRRVPLPVSASPPVPIRAAIPSEIFDHIASFADSDTLSAMSQVDFAWLARFHNGNGNVSNVTFGENDRRRCITCLTRADPNGPALSSRMASALSLRNVTHLSLSAALIQDDAFPELNLDKLGLDGNPLRLEVLEIRLLFHIRSSTRADLAQEMSSYEQQLQQNIQHNQQLMATLMAPHLQPPVQPPAPAAVAPASRNELVLRPSPRLLSLFDPACLRVCDPIRKRSDKGSSSAGRPEDVSRNSFRVSREAATAMARWSALKEVVLVDLDLHVTPNDMQGTSSSEHRFFLDVLGGGLPMFAGRVKVWWVLKKPAKELYWGNLKWLLREPVKYFKARKSLRDDKVDRAFLVLLDAEERESEKAKNGPAKIKIIARVEEENEER